MREETVDGPIARTVQVGDLIVHKWECDNRKLAKGNNNVGSLKQLGNTFSELRDAGQKLCGG
jgi:hypothetical protein